MAISSKFSSENYSLSLENIDRLSEAVEQFLREANIQSRNIIRMRLAMEEVLLNWRSFFGSETECSVFIGKRWGKPCLSIDVAGASCNPLAKDDRMDEFADRLLSTIGLNITYTYTNGRNRVSLMPRQEKPSSIQLILASVILALVCGIAAQYLPEAGRTLVLSIVTPLSDAFFRIIAAVAAPMIFLSVLYSIYNIGDVATFGTIGKRAISRFLRNAFLTVLFAQICLLPFLRLADLHGAIDFSQLSKLYDMILDIIPPNIMEPFTTGNTLQLIFIAIVCGIAMLILKDEVYAAAELVRQLNTLVTYIMGIISKLIPLMIFLCLFGIVASGNAGQLVSSWKIVIAFLVLSVAVTVFHLVLASLRFRISPGKLFKKLLPTFLIALTTASSSAAFETNLNSCKKGMGMDEKFVDFCVPLGTVLYKPTIGVNFIVMATFFGMEYDVEISIVWILMAVIVATILSIATPPVPGGPMTSISVLFLQLGIPNDAIGIAIALNVFFDFVGTATTVAMLQMNLIRISKDLDLIDVETLQN